MSTIYFLQNKQYDTLEFVDPKHTIIPIQSIHLPAVPKGSIVFTYESTALNELITRGMKVIYNPRNSLSPSIITDLSHVEYHKNVQYIGSELTRSYFKTFLEPLYNKWGNRFTWYDRDEQVGKILDIPLELTEKYEAIFYTQSQILPDAYAQYMNDLDRNAQYAVVLHPSVTPQYVDQILDHIEGSSVSNNGYVTKVSTGLRGSVSFIHYSQEAKLLGCASKVFSAPSQMSSQLQVLIKKHSAPIELYRLPTSILKHTNTKLNSEISNKFTGAYNSDYDAYRYRDPVLSEYNLDGTVEYHTKPYRDLLEEIITYYS